MGIMMVHRVLRIVLLALSMAGLAWRAYVLQFLQSEGWTRFSASEFLLGSVPFLAGILISIRLPLLVAPAVLAAIAAEWCYAVPVLGALSKDSVVAAASLTYLNPVITLFGLFVGVLLMYGLEQARADIALARDGI